MTLVHGDAMGDGMAEALRGAVPFDVVTCSSALIYMPSVPAALRRFASWLAPGGRLAVNSPTVRVRSPPNPSPTDCDPAIVRECVLGKTDPDRNIGVKHTNICALQCNTTL